MQAYELLVQVLSAAAGPAMFVATAAALGFGKGVQDRRGGRVGSIAIGIALILAGSWVIDSLLQPWDRYVASLALVIAVGVGYALLAVKGSPLAKITMFVTCTFALFFSRSTITAAFEYLQSSGTMEQSETTLPFYAALFASYLLVAVLFARHPLRGTQAIPAHVWTLLIWAPIIIAIISQVQTYLYGSGKTSAANLSNVLFSLLGLVAILLIYAMAQTVTAAFRDIMDRDAMNQRMQLTLDHVERSAAVTEQVRRDKHEMKNILFYLQSLAKFQQWEELEAFLDAEQRHFDLMEEYHTGNPLIDYLLTQKAAELRADGIRVCFEVVIPPDLPFDAKDLLGLLSNLLDNAAEASHNEPVGEAEVQLSMRVARGYLSIKVSNRCSTDVLARNPRLRTTKLNRRDHGVGLRVVRSITDRYDGSFSTAMDCGYFVAHALLAMPAE